MTSPRRRPRGAQCMPWQGFLAAALLAAAAATTAPRASPAADAPIDPQNGIRLFIRYDDASHSITTREEPAQQFHDILTRFTATPQDPAATTYHVSGRITDNNAHVPSALVPVYFASPTTPLSLAGVTNAHGEFTFTLRLAPAEQALYLSTPALEDATLYLGTSQRGTQINLGPFIDSKGMSMRAYPFQVLLHAAAHAPAPPPAEPAAPTTR